MTFYGKERPMSFALNNYRENDNLYVGLITNEDGYPKPWSDLTVNLSIKCDDDCSYIDVNNNGTEIIQWLVENNLGIPTGMIEFSGWCAYPEFKFNMAELKKHLAEDIQEL
jgi:hypothetical protein